MRWLADLVDDLRDAVRTLRNSGTFASAVVLTLGLGIGVNTAVFSVVNALLFRPLPVRDAHRLVVLGSRSPGAATLGPMSFSDLEDYRAATSDVLEDIAGYSVGFIGLATEHGRPARVLVTWITGNYFELLGIQPALGSQRSLSRGPFRHRSAIPIDQSRIAQLAEADGASDDAQAIIPIQIAQRATAP
jgi:putative ABC transport system permease protein